MDTAWISMTLSMTQHGAQIPAKAQTPRAQDGAGQEQEQRDRKAARDFKFWRQLKRRRQEIRPTPEELGRQLEREDLRTGGPNGRLILWWNCAGGVASKLNFIKNLIYKQAPALLFVSESNTKSGQINSHFNIGG